MAGRLERYRKLLDTGDADAFAAYRTLARREGRPERHCGVCVHHECDEDGVDCFRSFADDDELFEHEERTETALSLVGPCNALYQDVYNEAMATICPYFEALPDVPCCNCGAPVAPEPYDGHLRYLDATEGEPVTLCSLACEKDFLRKVDDMRAREDEWMDPGWI